VRIGVGSDHRGFGLKQTIRRHLSERGYIVVDFGCTSPESCDYPDFAYPVARAVASGEVDLGVLICSNGVGMSMVANKVRGVRAALCTSKQMASQSRRHNDANVLALGADNLPEPENVAILDEWLAATFEGGRHERRLRKMAEGECS